MIHMIHIMILNYATLLSVIHASKKWLLSAKLPVILPMFAYLTKGLCSLYLLCRTWIIYIFEVPITASTEPFSWP